MSLAAVGIALAPLVSAGAPPVGEALVSWEAPELYVPGEAYVVRVEVSARGGDALVPVWYLTSDGFDAEGKALGLRKRREEIPVSEGDVLTASIDLSRLLGERGDFLLTHAAAGDTPLEVDVLAGAPGELDFTKMNQGALSGYLVYLRTTRGEMLLEMWPNDAPGHVRNFLDLAYTGFYDDTTFHRVMPGFMIQGGDPEGTGTGSGPRQLKAEFNDRTHDRGVLSMARGASPDSASCQFFVMHADNPRLDGQYTTFGKMLVGFEALDKIATASGRPISGQGDVTPFERQVIERAVVVLADSRRQ